MNTKKIFSSLILTGLLASFVFADSAEVISVKGKVEVSRNNEWVTLNAGDKVSETEMISTGFQSEAKIKYKDSVMQLGALSRVTLSKMETTETKDVVNVYLNTGAVRSKVNHSTDKKVSYTVRNQVAVASVRGTDFISFDDGSVICYSGAVVLTPAALYDYVPSSESSSESEDPADGESNAGTDKNDVDPNAPTGGIMVLGGQSSQISATGQATPTFTVAVKSSTSAASTVKTAASSEAVSTAATVTAAINAAKQEAAEVQIEPVPVEPTPVEPTPVDPTPVDPTPVEPTPTPDTPDSEPPAPPVEPEPVTPDPVEPAPDTGNVDITPEWPEPVDPTPVTPAEPEPETGSVEVSPELPNGGFAVEVTWQD